MPLKIYNTLTRKKDKFVPLTPAEVRMYVCGITAYDFCHIGHARSAVVFDVIRRYLVFRGYRVRLVKNFTDLDDKIIRRAQEEGVSSLEVSERYVAEFRTDMAAMGVLAADVEPKATEHVPRMITFIERLIARGFAYVVDGSVYFEIRRFPPYGSLSGKNLDELLAGARVEVDERKRDPRDFALWKSAKPGEPSWDSPWGPGRPGWHIECSAMSMEYLGESFDIHGGGEDLIFPHHECEIAQSEAWTQKPFARYWIHNGFVNLGAEKMSKSLGNTLTIKDLLRRHSPEALRMYLIRPHYRSPLPYSDLRLNQAAQALQRFQNLIDEVNPLADPEILPMLMALEAGEANQSQPAGLLTNSNGVMRLIDELAPLNKDLAKEVRAHCWGFEQAMNDDFNTSQALGSLYELRHLLSTYRYFIAGANRPPDKAAKVGVIILIALGRVLGLFERRRAASELPLEVARLVAERAAARERRDWERSDELRKEIQRLGWTVEDTPNGPRVIRRAR